jgi:dihydroorotate dehydrogenase (fumarate)
LERENKNYNNNMGKLTTKYLGMTLNSPLLVSSCGLTSHLDNLKTAEDSGAGAVVLKSLFEEQISRHIATYSPSPGFPEADDYISSYIRANSVEEYLQIIRSAKASLAIPVIASINCFSSEGWTDFAKNIEDAGADALEVNVFFMPVDRKRSAADSEKIYLSLIEKLKSTLNIPVSVKVGIRFSNILYMIDQFYLRGVEGVVLFNRFFEPDIDVNTMNIVPASVFSDENERRYVLRSVAMASAQDIKIDISASTGVASGDDVVRYILAGAQTVQACSVLYKKGVPFLRTIISQLEEWMNKKEFSTINEFRGKLNWNNYDNPGVFERTQFMKYFSSVE